MSIYQAMGLLQGSSVSGDLPGLSGADIANLDEIAVRRGEISAGSMEIFNMALCRNQHAEGILALDAVRDYVELMRTCPGAPPRIDPEGMEIRLNFMIETARTIISYDSSTEGGGSLEEQKVRGVVFFGGFLRGKKDTSDVDLYCFLNAREWSGFPSPDKKEPGRDLAYEIFQMVKALVGSYSEAENTPECDRDIPANLFHDPHGDDWNQLGWVTGPALAFYPAVSGDSAGAGQRLCAIFAAEGAREGWKERCRKPE